MLIALLAVFIFYFYPRTAIITGYAAHSVCSCHFNSGRSLASIEASDNDIDIMSYTSNSIDEEAQTVTSSIFGLRKRTALYRKGYGCVLLGPNGEKPAVVEHIPPRKELVDSLPWPFGKKENTPAFSDVAMYKINNTIENAFDKKGEQLKKTRAVVVVYKGQVIAEKYGEGFDKNTPQLGWSMTKSILNALYGIQSRKGIVNIKEPVNIPEWKKDERAVITYNNLLQMNSGLEWEEDYASISDATKMLFITDDVSSMQLKKPLEFPIGTYWEYSSGTSNLLSGLLSQQFASQQAYLDFPYVELFNKIGMTSMVMETDLTGHYIGSSYSWATPRDWAKLGLLYLNKGIWNKERIFPDGWVTYSSDPAKDSKGGYGAHFWLNAGGKYPKSPKDMFYCAGFQGQYVYILPSQDLVIVRMGLLSYPEFPADELVSGIVDAIR